MLPLLLIALLASSEQASTAKAVPQQNPVIEEAVKLIKGEFATLPRIFVLDPATMRVKTDAPAFRRWIEGVVDPNIYVNSRGVIYTAAEADRRDDPGRRGTLMVLAALLAHEAVHSTTRSEVEPTRKELAVLMRFLDDPTLSLNDRTTLWSRVRHVREHRR